MNVGVLGGTFDPIHRGHLALARASLDRFALERIYFVPAHIPPHKQGQRVTSYFHRYAMVSLATRGEKAFVPSLLEAPPLASPPGSRPTGHEGDSPELANYTIDTVRRLRQRLAEHDRIFLLVGIDAFKDIASWHEVEALFAEVEFVVARRPGYAPEDLFDPLRQLLKSPFRPPREGGYREAEQAFQREGMRVHWLDNVDHDVSSTAIRTPGSDRGVLRNSVDPSVAEYIQKMGLCPGG